MQTAKQRDSKTNTKARQEVCLLYKVSPQAISKWIKQYKKGGFPYLDSDKRGGPRTEKLLSPQQERAIKHYIHNYSPDELSLPFFLWTRKAVQMIILKKFSVEVELKTLSPWLKAWGFSPQKPAKKEKAEINWLDESGIQSNDNQGRNYAKKEKRHQSR